MRRVSFCLFFLYITVVLCDLPMHCEKPQVLGTWIFEFGPSGQNKTVDCNTHYSIESRMRVQLKEPNVAIDLNSGMTGTWTMIYNQGFEIIIGGRKYFAFSNYRKHGKVVTSLCHETLPGNGWAHDSGVDPKNWACFSGRRYMGDMQTVHEATSTHELPDLENQVFESDAEYVSALNAAQSSWTAKDYPDLHGRALADVMRIQGSFKPPQADEYLTRLKAAQPEEDEALIASLPTHWDWRNVGGVDYVGPIWDQLGCGSCYAFGVLAAIEGRIRVRTQAHVKLTLSPQQVVSCCQYSQGCDGGMAYLVAKYAEDYGLVELRCMAYEQREVPCDWMCERPDRFRHYSTNYEYIGGYFGASTQGAMMKEIYEHGPIAVSVMVTRDFGQYAGGIWHHVKTDVDSKNGFPYVNHIVALVGWGQDDNTGEKYWILRNSWGRHWGEHGYMRIRRGTDEAHVESLPVRMDPVLA